MTEVLKKKHKQVIYPTTQSIPHHENKVKIRLVSPSREHKTMATNSKQMSMTNSKNQGKLNQDHIQTLPTGCHVPIQLGPHRSRSPKEKIELKYINPVQHRSSTIQSSLIPASTSYRIPPSPQNIAKHVNIHPRISFSARYSINASPKQIHKQTSPNQSIFISSKPAYSNFNKENCHSGVIDHIGSSMAVGLGSHSSFPTCLNSSTTIINSNHPHKMVSPRNQMTSIKLKMPAETPQTSNNQKTLTRQGNSSIKQFKSKASIWATDLMIQEQSHHSNALDSEKNSAKEYQQQLRQIKTMQEQILQNNTEIQMLISKNQNKTNQMSTTTKEVYNLDYQLELVNTQLHQVQNKCIIKKYTEKLTQMEREPIGPPQQTSAHPEKQVHFQTFVDQKLFILDGSMTHKSIINKLNIGTGRNFQDQDNSHREIQMKPTQIKVENKPIQIRVQNKPIQIHQVVNPKQTQPLQLQPPRPEISPQKAPIDITPSTITITREIIVKPPKQTSQFNEIQKVSECSSFIYMSKHEEDPDQCNNQQNNPQHDRVIEGTSINAIQQEPPNDKGKDKLDTELQSQQKVSSSDDLFIDHSVKLSIKKHTTIKMTQPPCKSTPKENEEIQPIQNQANSNSQVSYSRQLHNRSYSGACGIDHTDLRPKRQKLKCRVDILHSQIHQLEMTKDIGILKGNKQEKEKSHGNLIKQNNDFVGSGSGLVENSRLAYSSGLGNNTGSSGLGKSSKFTKYNWGSNKKICNKIYL